MGTTTNVMPGCGSGGIKDHAVLFMVQPICSLCSRQYTVHYLVLCAVKCISVSLHLSAGAILCIAQCSMHRMAVHNDAGVAGLVESPPTGRTVLSSSRQATTILIIIIIIISKQCATGKIFKHIYP